MASQFTRHMQYCHALHGLAATQDVCGSMAASDMAARFSVLDGRACFMPFSKECFRIVHHSDQHYIVLSVMFFQFNFGFGYVWPSSSQR